MLLSGMCSRTKRMTASDRDALAPHGTSMARQLISRSSLEDGSFLERARHPGPGGPFRSGARGLAGRDACRPTNRRSGMALRIRVADVEPGLFLRRTPQWNAARVASTFLSV